jgi:Domain of unknown function (DUF4412)
MLKKAAHLIACLVLWTSIADADYIVKQKLETDGQPQDVTIKIKETKCRVDTGEQLSAIIDSTTGETTMLIHPDKIYTKVSPEQLKEQAEAMKNLLSGQTNNSAEVELKPTGKKETLSGYETEEYKTKINNIEVTFMIAKTFPNYQKLVTTLYNVQSSPAMMAFRSMSIPPEKYPGMPMRSEVEVMAKKVVTTLDSAVETTLPDSDFAIPPDYKEMGSAAPTEAPPPQNGKAQ